MRRWKGAVAGVLAAAVGLCVVPAVAGAHSGRYLKIEEATIDDIQDAIKRRQVTTTEIVEAYLERIKAYNGTCVNEPEGILGPISTIPHPPKIHALITLNFRPDTREDWGFAERKPRSMTASADDDAGMPDALEVAAAQD